LCCEQQMRVRTSTWVFTVCGVWLIFLGLYFMLLRPGLLPEDMRFLGTPLAQIRTAVPRLESWLSHVFTVMGGFITGTGVLIIFVATVALPLRKAGTTWAIGVSGATTVVLMSATNFMLLSDFRWILLVPVIVWLCGIIFYTKGD
jgi:hypothetical protein